MIYITFITTSLSLSPTPLLSDVWKIRCADASSCRCGSEATLVIVFFLLVVVVVVVVAIAAVVVVVAVELLVFVVFVVMFASNVYPKPPFPTVPRTSY